MIPYEAYVLRFYIVGLYKSERSSHKQRSVQYEYCQCTVIVYLKTHPVTVVLKYSGCLLVTRAAALYDDNYLNSSANFHLKWLKCGTQIKLDAS